MLQEAELQPHRTLYWKQGYAPAFESKALDVLWYYERIEALEAKGEPVCALDWKPGLQLLGRPHEDRPMRPGCPRRREFEYIRLGVGLVFLMVRLATGRFRTAAPKSRSGPCLTRLLEEHLETLPRAKRIHYILDNAPTPTSAHTRNWLTSQRGRVRFQHTPKSSAWLNQAESGSNCFSAKYLRGRLWHSADEFPSHVREATRNYHRDYAHPFDWTFTRNRFHEWQRQKHRSRISSTGR